MDRHDWDERYASSTLLWSAGPNRFLEAEVAGLAPGRAIDLACGEGRNALWLAEQGWDVTAVDFSTVAIERGRELGARRGVDVEWVLADVLEYEPALSTFDLVVVCYLQIPPDELRTVLARGAGAVTQGGVLLAIGHHERNLTEGYGGPKDPTLLWSAEAVTGALGGLHIERADTVLRPVDGATAIDVLVRASHPPDLFGHSPGP